MFQNVALFIKLGQTSYKIKKLQISPIVDYSIALTVACIRGPSFRLAILTKISGFKGYRFSLLAAMVAVCKDIESFQKTMKSQEITDTWETWLLPKSFNRQDLCAGVVSCRIWIMLKLDHWKLDSTEEGAEFSWK